MKSLRHRRSTRRKERSRTRISYAGRSTRCSGKDVKSLLFFMLMKKVPFGAVPLSRGGAAPVHTVTYAVGVLHCGRRLMGIY